MLIKGTNRKKLREVLDLGLAAAETAKVDLRIVHVEIDPINLM